MYLLFLIFLHHASFLASRHPDSDICWAERGEVYLGTMKFTYTWLYVFRWMSQALNYTWNGFLTSSLGITDSLPTFDGYPHYFSVIRSMRQPSESTLVFPAWWCILKSKILASATIHFWQEASNLSLVKICQWIIIC